MKEFTGYELSRRWFDFCFENPEKITPSHTAIYFFAIEHCNRMGWKEKFGFPTQMAMDAIGIKKHQTYIKFLQELVEWGFVKMVQKSQNQYSANIISLMCALPKNGKALDKARLRHGAKHGLGTGQSTGQSKDSIDKQYNNPKQYSKPLTINENAEEDFEAFEIENENAHEIFGRRVMDNKLDKEAIEVSTRMELTEDLIKQFNANLTNGCKEHMHYSEYKKHLTNWLPKKPNHESKQQFTGKHKGHDISGISDEADRILQEFARNNYSGGNNNTTPDIGSIEEAA